MPGQFDPAKLQKFLKAKASASTGARVGGAGTVRRKHKAQRKGATHDDKRLKSTLSKLNVRDIPAIEEVNLFKDDGHVIHFAAPKVQASIAANTYVVSGNAETKKLQDLLPGIINQLGPDNLEDLKKIYASYKGEGGGLPAALAGKAAGGDDDEMPELVDNFEEVAAKKEAPKPAAAPAAAPKAAEAAPAAAAAPAPKAEKKGSKAPKEEAKPKAAEAAAPKAAEAPKPKAETPSSPKVEAKKAAAAPSPKVEAKKEAAAPSPAKAAPKAADAKKEAPKGSGKKPSGKKA